MGEIRFSIAAAGSSGSTACTSLLLFWGPNPPGGISPTTGASAEVPRASLYHMAPLPVLGQPGRLSRVWLGWARCQLTQQQQLNFHLRSCPILWRAHPLLKLSCPAFLCLSPGGRLASITSKKPHSPSTRCHPRLQSDIAWIHPKN